MNEADFVRKESVSRQLTLTGIMIGAFQIGLALVLYFLTKQ